MVTREQPNGVKCGSSTILVKGLNTEHHNKSFLEMYFSNQKKCRGGKIKEVIVKGEEAYITYTESEGTTVMVVVLILMFFIVAARVAEKGELIAYGHKLEVHLVDTAPATEPQVSAVTDTILVKGLMECHTESALKLFFTNKKKCGGGDVTKIIIKEESAYISFADPKGSQLVQKYLYAALKLGLDGISNTFLCYALRINTLVYVPKCKSIILLHITTDVLIRIILFEWHMTCFTQMYHYHALF